MNTCRLQVQFLAIFAGVLLMGGGCGQASNNVEPNTNQANQITTPDGFMTYKSKDGWSIAYPEDWKVESDGEYTDFIAPDLADGSTPNVNINHSWIGKNQDIDQLRQEEEDDITAEGVKIIKSELVDLPAGSAFKIEAIHNLAGSTKIDTMMRARMYGILDGPAKNYYTVLVFTTLEGNPLYQEEFEIMAKSFIYSP